MRHEKAYAAPNRGITRRRSRVGTTIRIDLGDIWSHYCTLNEDVKLSTRVVSEPTPSGLHDRTLHSGTSSVADHYFLTVSLLRLSMCGLNNILFGDHPCQRMFFEYSAKKRPGPRKNHGTYRSEPYEGFCDIRCVVVGARTVTGMNRAGDAWAQCSHPGKA